MVYRDMLIRQFNRQPLRRKFLIIYIVGFLIPIISINILFSFNIYKSHVKYSRENFNNIMAKVKLLIESELQEVQRLIYTIYIDSNITSLLRNEYEGLNDYLKALMNTESLETSMSQIQMQNNDAMIYTKNPTVYPDSNITYISRTVAEENWFRAFVKSKSNNFLFFDKERPEFLSYIRKLNYLTGQKNSYDNLIKVDIPISKFFVDIEEQMTDGEISFISNKGETVFNTKRTIKEYETFSVTFTSKTLARWEIIGRTPKVNFFSGSNGRNLIISLAIIVLIGSIIIYVLSRSFYSRIYTLTQKISSIKHGSFDPINISEDFGDEITELSLSYNIMVHRIKELINEVSEAKLREKNIEIVKRKAQLNALRSQINPHYLFNVLESIRMKSLIKGEKETAAIIKHLSKSFRHIISWDTNIIRTEEELEIARDFLTVQKYRFGDKLDYKIDMDEEVKNLLIPKLTLQPFIENSCIHGIEKISRNGKIILSIRKNHDIIVCSIVDNGIGIDSESLKKLNESIDHLDMESDHIGFSNAYWRLKNHYPNLTFKIDSQINKGTKITIKIPI